MSDAYDFVIVGAGSAGCVLANRLSENGRYSVCLLEAGPADRYPWIHIPIGYAKTMFHPVYNWGFYTDPDPGMNGRRIYWPRGKVFGGCSSINGLIYIRGQRADYDAWADARYRRAVVGVQHQVPASAHRRFYRGGQGAWRAAHRGLQHR